MDAEIQAGYGKLIKKAVILSCILGLIAAVYLIRETSKGENYVVLYLEPGSYSNYLEDDTVRFTYGIQQYGVRSSTYILDIYLDDRLVATRDLKQRSGENEVELQLPEGMKFPTKVKLTLKTDYGENEVHFWLNGRKEENATRQ
jgi:uncharacterized membrane protein